MEPTTDDESRYTLAEVVQVLASLVDRCSPTVEAFLRPAVDAVEQLTDLLGSDPTGFGSRRVVSRRWKLLARVFATLSAPDAPEDPPHVRATREVVRRLGAREACEQLGSRAARHGGEMESARPSQRP